MTSNYKEELGKVFSAFRRHVVFQERLDKAAENGGAVVAMLDGLYLTQDQAFAAIDRLNADVIGEDEPYKCDCGSSDCGDFMVSAGANSTKEELRQKFGIVNTDIDVGIKKEDK